jgi:hypothetical protein
VRATGRLPIRSRPAALIVALLLLFVAAGAQAVVLDWDANAWSAGNNSQSFNVDPTNAGNDVTFTFTGATQKFRNDPVSGQATPVTNQTVTGGLNPVQTSLLLGVDFHQNNTITLTVTFAPSYALGVQNVSFSIFGIDKNGSTYQDQVAAIYATSVDGVTQIAPTITNLGSAVTLSGSGSNQLLTGNSLVPESGAGSGAGNATIDFGGAAIVSFTLVYQDGIGARPNPTFQDIALGDLTFTPVPELNPALASALSCIFAVAITFWLRRRALARSQANR